MVSLKPPITSNLNISVNSKLYAKKTLAYGTIAQGRMFDEKKNGSRKSHVMFLYMKFYVLGIIYLGTIRGH